MVVIRRATTSASMVTFLCWTKAGRACRLNLTMKRPWPGAPYSS